MLDKMIQLIYLRPKIYVETWWCPSGAEQGSRWNSGTDPPLWSGTKPADFVISYWLFVNSKSAFDNEICHWN